jgi:hypothetical protein
MASLRGRHFHFNATAPNACGAFFIRKNPAAFKRYRS